MNSKLENTALFDGAGTAEKPYQITTVDDLVTLSEHPQSWNEHFVLTQDLDMTDVKLTPIGSSECEPFTGSFDGQGYIIRNLKIHSKLSSIGLFGFVKGVKISNVNLGDLEVSCDNSHISCGGIVGEATRKTVLMGCSVTGTISSQGNHICCGGIAGLVCDTTILDCSVLGTISSDSSFVTSCGGGVGEAKRKTVMSDCSFSGSVLSEASHSSRCGGIIGNANWKVDVVACSVSGEISSDSAFVSSCGGIAGEASGSTISKCSVSDSNISSEAAHGSHCGGIVGEASKSTIEDCTASSKLLSESSFSAYCGGIGGEISRTEIRGCTASGPITCEGGRFSDSDEIALGRYKEETSVSPFSDVPDSFEKMLDEPLG